jgi:hypothetical protein
MRVLLIISALIATVCGVFFTFYTVRLYYVARFFTTPPRNGGAYIGAVVFPLLAVAFGLGARWCWRRSRVNRVGTA